jgi:glutathione S-transferase
MNIVVHHLENSRSQRVLWLLEELELPYEVVRYERNSVTGSAPPIVGTIHALGKLPLVQDGNLTIAETGAIVEHLVRETGGRLGKPADPEDGRRYTHFMHYAEGSLMPPLFALLLFKRMGEAGDADAAALRESLATHLRWMDAELSERRWFVGSIFTAADIMMSFPLEAARQRGGLDDSYANLNAFLARIHARAAYRRALETGGPYAFV